MTPYSTLYSTDQGILAGAVTAALKLFVAEHFTAPNSVRWIDDAQGTHQPVTRVILPNNTYLVATVHVSDQEHELAQQLAAIAHEAGSDRLARLLGLVAGLLDDDEIARVIGGGT